MSMACAQVSTVTGPVAPEALGRTLMHEHVLVGYPGWEADTAHPGPDARERFRIGVERVQELQALGFTSMLDPCPNDLGRDVELMAKIAQHTGFQIVCATGLYKQAEGGVAYWHFRSRFVPSVDAMAELFEQELREGIGDTGIRAGIIKVATGPHAMSDYERTIFAAAAKAAIATGAPITTHTDLGTVGDQQQQLLTTAGVPAHRIVIGHSCGTSDHAYHLGIARGGSYLGFDRFGLDVLHPDAERIASLVRLLEVGAGDRVVVSHDSVWCWRGQPIPPPLLAQMTEQWNPTHFSRRIIPRLREAGVSDAAIEALLVDNPRRFFAGAPLATLP
jgi:phosphotriesterase-related protein